jgi:integrase
VTSPLPADPPTGAQVVGHGREVLALVELGPVTLEALPDGVFDVADQGGSWADEWWQGWAARPRRSPAALEAAESHLRLHIRPYFDARPLGSISVLVQRWQDTLEVKLSHNLVMACRSLLNRILQAAVDEQLIAANPVQRVRPPKRQVDPEAVFGRARRRAYTPEEFGRLLAVALPFYRDHLIVQAGTGLRSGELLGLRGPAGGPGVGPAGGRRGPL